MKTIIFLLSSFLFLSNANGQYKIGVRGGISFSNRDGSNSNSTDLITAQVSGFAVIPLGRLVILQPSIGYHPKGNKYRNLTFSDQSGSNNGYGDLSIRFDNIEIAAAFQYIVTSNNERKLLLGLGPYFSYAIGGMAKWKNVSGQAEPPAKSKISFGNGEKRFEAGVYLLLTFQVNNRWILNINYDRAITGVYANAYQQQSKLYSSSKGITAGYIFK
jgi:hypothetical protein